MLRFTSPAWLAALGVLAIPVLLHLWSRRPGQRVRLGSLRHLQGAPGPRAWGRRLDDLPLLALRLAGLAACVLGLAGLSWQRPLPPTTRPAVVVLALPSALTDSADFLADPLVDSLRRAGTTIHTLSEGFPLIDEAAGQPDPDRGRAQGVWSLLAALSDSLPPGSEILVLGEPAAAELGPRRLQTASSIRWRQVGARAAPVEEMRWVGPGDTVRVLARRQGFNTLRWLHATKGADEPGVPAPTTRLLTKRSVAVPMVYLVSDEQVSDEVSAIRAGITAAFQAGIGLEPDISIIPSDGSPPLTAGSALIVWLSSQSVSESVRAAVDSGATLLEFPSEGETRAVASSVHGISGNWWALEGVRADRTADSLPGPGVLMVDDDGEPFLTVEGYGQGQWYRIAARTDPAWSNLATGAALPELIFALLTLDHPAVARAPVGPGQASATAAPAAVTRTDEASLRSILLLLTALLVSGERIATSRSGRRRG